MVCRPGGVVCPGGEGPGRGARRGTADQPRAAVVPRGGGDQAGPGRVPGCRARPDPAGTAGPAAVGGPGTARPGAVHAEEPAEVHAGLGTGGAAVGGEFASRGVLRAVRRPPYTALVR